MFENNGCVEKSSGAAWIIFTDWLFLRRLWLAIQTFFYAISLLTAFTVTGMKQLDSVHESRITVEDPRVWRRQNSYYQGLLTEELERFDRKHSSAVEIKEASFVDGECSICIQQIEKESLFRMPNCQHVYHKSCIFTWLKTKSRCPLCQ